MASNQDDGEALRKANREASVENVAESALPQSTNTLIPVLTAESVVKYDLDGNLVSPTPQPRGPVSKLNRSFNSCEVIYTKADSKMKPQPLIQHPKKGDQKYRSHEVLPSHQPPPKPHPLLRAQSEQQDVDMEDSKPTTVAHSRWGMLQSKAMGQNQTKKEKRRAQIVAAVTRRLYSDKKKVEPEQVASLAPENRSTTPREDVVEDDEEPEELKICARARATLQELTKRALGARKLKRMFADTESQTDFCGHTVRVKEVSVSTDEPTREQKSGTDNDGRTSVHTQCSIRPHSLTDEIYTRWSYHYRNGSGIYRPWHYYTDSVIVTERRFIKTSEEDFSDDSLDSNHDLDVHMKSMDSEKPSIWKVYNITSGKTFSSQMPILNSSSKTVGKEVATDLTGSTNSGSSESGTASCECHGVEKDLHAMLKSLQLSVEEVNAKPDLAACFIRLCECDQKYNCQRQSRGTQTYETDSFPPSQVNIFNINCQGHEECGQGTTFSNFPNNILHLQNKESRLQPTKLTDDKLRTFFHIWRKKSSVQRTSFAQMSGNIFQTNVSTQTSEADKNHPCASKPQEHNSVEIPFGFDEQSGKQTINFKALSSVLNELINNNNYLTVDQDLGLTYKTACKDMLTNYIQNQNSCPALVQGNHKITTMPLLTDSYPFREEVKDKESKTSTSHQNRQFGLEKQQFENRLYFSERNNVKLSSLPEDNTLAAQLDSQTFPDENELCLPRLLPRGRSQSDQEAQTLIDSTTERWLEIKNIILGLPASHYVESDDKISSLKQEPSTKKRVSWKDLRGFGDLVDTCSDDVTPADDSSTDVSEVNIDEKQWLQYMPRFKAIHNRSAYSLPSWQTCQDAYIEDSEQEISNSGEGSLIRNSSILNSSLNIQSRNASTTKLKLKTLKEWQRPHYYYHEKLKQIGESHNQNVVPHLSKSKYFNRSANFRIQNNSHWSDLLSANNRYESIFHDMPYIPNNSYKPNTMSFLNYTQTQTFHKPKRRRPIWNINMCTKSVHENDFECLLKNECNYKIDDSNRVIIDSTNNCKCNLENAVVLCPACYSLHGVSINDYHIHSKTRCAKHVSPSKYLRQLLAIRRHIVGNVT